MNILHAGDKLPVQRGFFKNSTSNLLLIARPKISGQAV